MGSNRLTCSDLVVLDEIGLRPFSEFQQTGESAMPSFPSALNGPDGVRPLLGAAGRKADGIASALSGI